MIAALCEYLAKRHCRCGRITLAVKGAPIEQRYVLRAADKWSRGVLACLNDAQREAMINALFEAEKTAFYTRVNAQDAEETARFSWENLAEPIAINLWDELDEGSTQMRVHVSGMPLSERKEVLRWVQQQLPQDWMSARGIVATLQVSDGAVEYPGLLATEYKATLHFCWQLRFSGLDESSFDALNEKLATLLPASRYKQCAVSYSCES
jgi:hypothetical protein